MLVHDVVVFLSAVVAASALEFKAQLNHAQFATITAREASILWEPSVPFMPNNTASFTGAQTQWSSDLDGPGDGRRQALLVRARLPCILRKQPAHVQACKKRLFRHW